VDLAGNEQQLTPAPAAAAAPLHAKDDPGGARPRGMEGGAPSNGEGEAPPREVREPEQGPQGEQGGGQVGLAAAEEARQKAEQQEDKGRRAAEKRAAFLARLQQGEAWGERRGSEVARSQQDAEGSEAGEADAAAAFGPGSLSSAAAEALTPAGKWLGESEQLGMR